MRTAYPLSPSRERAGVRGLFSFAPAVSPALEGSNSPSRLIMKAEVALDAGCKRREMHRISVNSAGANIFNGFFETQKSTRKREKNAENRVKTTCRSAVYHDRIKQVCPYYGLYLLFMSIGASRIRGILPQHVAMQPRMGQTRPSRHCTTS